MRSVVALLSMHAITNAILFTLGYYWLGMGDARTSQLLLSALIAIVFVALGCASYGAVLVYCGSTSLRSARFAWLEAIWHLPALFVLAISVALIYWLAGLGRSALDEPAFRLASWLTLQFRRPVTPESVAFGVNVLVGFLRWIVIPVLVLPLAMNVALHGFSGFRQPKTNERKRLYWVMAPLLVGAMVWLPGRLLAWIPRVGSFDMEATSFILRALVAYLFFVLGWLGLAFITSGGRPRFTQPSTAPSP